VYRNVTWLNRFMGQCCFEIWQSMYTSVAQTTALAHKSSSSGFCSILEHFSKPWLNFQYYHLRLDLTSLCACCLGWLNFASRSRLFCVHPYYNYKLVTSYGAQSISRLCMCYLASKCCCKLPGSGNVCSLSSASAFSISGVLGASWSLKIITT
jgi:hypothetical protein